MSEYLLIESRSPAEAAESATGHALAVALAKAGEKVTLFLVQNGVLPARIHADARQVEAAAQAGVRVFADDFSLRERGIAPDALKPGVASAPIEIVIDRLAEGVKVIWN